MKVKRVVLGHHVIVNRRTTDSIDADRHGCTLDLENDRIHIRTPKYGEHIVVPLSNVAYYEPYTATETNTGAVQSEEDSESAVEQSESEASGPVRKPVSRAKRVS